MSKLYSVRLSVIMAALLMSVLAGCTGQDRKTSTATAPKEVVGWRKDGTGRYPKATPVLEWNGDEKKNILWIAKVEGGTNYSSPIVVGDRLFVSAESNQLICVNRKDGKILWQKSSGFEDLPAGTKAKDAEFPTSCGYSTPTATSDGKHVYVVYGTGIAACYDLQGNRKWIKHYPFEQVMEDGRTASPLLADGKLVLCLGHVFAVDPRTGGIVWEAKDVDVAYGSPVATKIEDTVVAVTPMGTYIRVSDGKVLARSMGATNYASPIVFDGVVFFVSGFAEAVKLPEKVEEKMKFKYLWEAELEGEFYASPVYHDGLIYCANNEGMFYIIDAKNGKTLQEKRLMIPDGGGLGEEANIYSSLALVGKYILVGNDVGNWIMVEPGRAYKEAANNILDEGSGACPASVGKYLYLRDGERLYCVGKP